MVRRQVCIQRTRTGVWLCLIWRATGLLKDLHTWADPRRGTQCGDERRVGLFLASADPRAEGRRKLKGEVLFIRECCMALRNLSVSSDLLQPPKELYRELVVSSASDLLSEWHGWIAEEVHSHWNWALGSSFLTIPSFRSPGGLHGTRFPFSARTSERAWQTCPIVLATAVTVSSSVLGSGRGVDDSHRTQAARVARRWLRCRQRFSSVSG